LTALIAPCRTVGNEDGGRTTCSKRPIGERQLIYKIAPIHALEVRGGDAPIREFRMGGNVVSLDRGEIVAKVDRPVLDAERGFVMFLADGPTRVL
jgi:hypothetical protein